MNPCSNAGIGKLLHSYEMGWLSDADTELFEQHCLTCEACFGQIQKFRAVSEILIEDSVIADYAAEGARAAQPGRSWVQRLREAIWPDTNLFLRPALTYLALAVLIPLAYQGFSVQAPGTTDVIAARTVELVGTRNAITTIDPWTDESVVLRFAFSGARISSTYEVSLSNESGEILYHSDTFGFDGQQAGLLSLPVSGLSSGNYKIVISDPEDSPPLGTDTLYFTVGP